MESDKKWVFEEMVENERDAVGFVGYAMYKGKKSKLAKSYRDKGESEEIIQQKVTEFHETVLAAEQIEDFRSQAEGFLSSLIENVSIDIEYNLTKQHEKKLEELESSYKKKSKDLDKQFSKWKTDHKKKVERTHIEEQSIGSKAGHWLLQGLQGTLATLIISGALITAAVMTIPPDKRNAFLAKEILGIEQKSLTNSAPP